MATVVKMRRVDGRARPDSSRSLTPEEISLVRHTFQPVAEIRDQAAALFYTRLFELDPMLENLFEDADMAEQGKKLMATIGVVVGALDKIGEIIPTVRRLGAKHVEYGVKPEHYDTVGVALIDTLKKTLGDEFTSEAQAAWVKMYSLLATTMKAAAAGAALNGEGGDSFADVKKTQSAESASKEETVVGDTNVTGGTGLQMQTFKTMVDAMPVAVMVADLESFEIIYMNNASLVTLRSIEGSLPVKADDMVGTCIDVFHKDPSHQRRLLADPSNLPWSTKITVGPETLDLLVSPIFDADGKYSGAMLTWSVITRTVKLADDFEINIKGIAEAVSSASTEMQSSAEALAATAEETSNQANTVAAASEELSSSINEISQQVSRSASISAEAVSEAQRSEQQIQGLANAADKIGEVVNLINDIAGQTNLLALNATIEAARAGEAGKGFAVVASEVKNLANQTAKATEEISGQVSSIQSATRDAVGAIAGISKIINELNEIATAISSAVEEQGAATQEVATNITGVTSAASETGQSATQVLEAAAELSRQSEILGTEADSFLTEMRK